MSDTASQRASGTALNDVYNARILELAGNIPRIGKLVTNDADSYQYLAESIRVHPDQDTLQGMMEDAGFVNCDYHDMTGGVVALHRGFKA